MCGIAVIYAENGDAIPLALDVADKLTNRGDDSKGMTYRMEDGRLETIKNLPPVVTHLQGLALGDVRSMMAMIQNRYRTSGGTDWSQPAMYGGEAMTHNGNDPRHHLTREKLVAAADPPESEVDTDTIAKFASRMRQETKGDMVKVLQAVDKEFDGALELCFMLDNGEAWAFRHDGLRPLLWTRNEAKRVCAVASEKGPLEDIADGAPIESIPPGYALQIKSGSIDPVFHLINADPLTEACPFEDIYLSNKRNVIDGRAVLDSRKAFGTAMGKLDETFVTSDMLCAFAPETSRTVAMAYAEAARVRMSDTAITRNTKKRSFIIDERQRMEMLKKKFSFSREEIAGNKVLLLEDSVVRSSTLQVMLPALWEAGATEVHVRSCAPPILNVCPYGVAIRTLQELLTRKIGHWEMGEDGMLSARTIEAANAYWASLGDPNVRLTSFRYLPLPHLNRCMSSAKKVCTGCFTDDTEGYPTEGGRQAARDAQQLYTLGKR